MTDHDFSQRLVLRALIDAHPRLVGTDELALELADAPRVREALKMLVDDGLATRLGDRIGVSRAAVRFNALGPLWLAGRSALVGVYRAAALTKSGETGALQARTSSQTSSTSVSSTRPSSTRCPIGFVSEARLPPVSSAPGTSPTAVASPESSPPCAMTVASNLTLPRAGIGS
jgi:hypothetical protein